MKDRIEIRKAGTTFFLDDREATEAEYRARYPLPSLEGPVPQPVSCSAWPMVSEACGVHQHQVDEANARAKQHGLGVSYDTRGFCHIPDRATRRQLLKLEGFHDRNGGYGDG